jgi:hypothetical protein
VLGDAAIAGEGGSGGEMVNARISGLQAGQVLHIEVGKGGVGGKNGGDSSISLVGAYGELTPLLRAKGGKAGKAGRHGNLSGFAREVTQAEIKGGARMVTLMLAEIVRVKGDLVTILDGGWGSYNVPALPHTMEWAVFSAYYMTGLVVPTVIRCVIRVKDPSQKIVFQHEFHFEKLDDRVVRTLYTNLLKFEANEFGVWCVEVASGEHVLAAIPVHVLQTTSVEP